MAPRRSARVAVAESKTLGVFAVLPEELLKALLALLPPDARLRCVVLSKRFAALLADGAMWAHLRFGDTSAPRGVDDAGLAALCARATPRLLCLDLSCHAACKRLTPAGVVAALRDASGLEELRFKRNWNRRFYSTLIRLSAAQAVALRASCPRLTRGWANVRPSADETLDDALAAFRGIIPHGVFLHRGSLRDNDARAIAAAIDADASLQQLRLNKNSIGPDGASALADALATNHSLRSLDISSNRTLGDAGAAALARGLARNSTLLQLNMSDCGVGTEGALAIAAALERNQTLELLIMSRASMLDRVISDAAFAALRAVRAARVGRNGAPLELHWLQRLRLQSIADDDVVHYFVQSTLQFAQLIPSYAAKYNVPVHAVQLELEDGRVIDQTHILGKYDLDDDAVIYVRLLEEPQASQ